MKKLLCLLMLLLCLCALAAAEEPVEYTSGDYKYVLLEDGTAEITDYLGTAAELVVPDTLSGYKVTSIGAYTFYSCSSLRSVTLPDSLNIIGDGAFNYCTSLTSITLPDSLNIIGDDAFFYCDSLTSITLPDSLTSIGNEAFVGCSSLTSITLPDSVTQIGANPFRSCGKLTTIRVSPRHPVLATIDGVLFDKTEKKLICYPCAITASDYDIPNGILSIGNEAFSFCESLTSVTIPDGVTSIGDLAFYYCESLTSVTLPDSLTSIGYGAFYSCPEQLTFTVPMDSWADQWCRDNNLYFTYPNANDWLLN